MMFTNGFSDNVPQEEWLDCLNQNFSVKEGRITSYSKAAECQVLKANLNSTWGEYRSPYAKAAKAKRIHRVGGRVDDITVTVAQLFDYPEDDMYKVTKGKVKIEKGSNDYRNDEELFKEDHFNHVISPLGWDWDKYQKEQA